MKKTFIQSIKALGLAAILFAGVSVSAWNAPGTAIHSPAGDNALPVVAAINTGAFDQIKTGGIFSQKTLVSPLSFFKKVFLPGNSATVRVGSSGASGVDFGTFGDPNYQAWTTKTVPLTIDLNARAQRTNAIEFKSGQVCSMVTRLINTNAPAFEFWNDTKNTQADLIAKQVKLTGGNPGPGKILVSVDANGRGVWATPKLASNGKDITFDYSDSPVGICGTPVPPTTYQCVDNTQAGCFTADTYVTMADGSRKLIQDVQVGDTVKAVNGTNTVLALIRPKLGNQPVYSINGGRKFFTANHPFLSTAGWKSIDPATTKKEVPDLVVSKLQIGDVLKTEAGNITVQSLAPATESSTTQLYNFELNGDHTYYADGYAVHNKVAIISGGTYLAPLPGYPDRELIKSTSGWGTSCQTNSDCGGIADVHMNASNGYNIACDNLAKVCGWDVVPNMITSTTACSQVQ